MASVVSHSRGPAAQPALETPSAPRSAPLAAFDPIVLIGLVAPLAAAFEAIPILEIPDWRGEVLAALVLSAGFLFDLWLCRMLRHGAGRLLRQAIRRVTSGE